MKAFQKVYLAPGEKKTVALALTENDLAYYNTKVHAWVVENGEYPVCIGASAQNIRLQGSISVTGHDIAAVPYSDTNS